MATTDTTTPDPATLDATAAAADAVSQSLGTMGDVALGAKTNMGVLDVAIKDTKGVFDGFTTALSKFGISLKANEALTTQQAVQFGLLTTAVFGSRKAFDSLGGIDTKPLSTFGDQITFLSTNLGDNSTTIGALVDVAEKGFGVVVPDAAKKSVSAIKGFLGNLTESADNALRLQNAYVQLSAKTGNLGNVFAQAGSNLSDMNSILAKQNSIMSDSMKATGITESAVQSYYMLLGTVPKALDATVTSTGNADNKIGMLTATIKLATGTGREYSEIVEDLKTAFRDYGLEGESALKFTERFSELSNKFGVELDDVRKALIGSANAFTSFADAGEHAAAMSEGLAGIMNAYVGALQQTGLSGRNAVNVVTNMTNALANMRVEQKAFLSAQTGGPGGLMGAFQIEKLLREGKIDEVFDKVKDTMQKQFGKIVTLEEATKSPAAASQLEKQVLLLQKGPLGQFVKSDQDAFRVLEALRTKGPAGAAAGVQGLDTMGLQNAMDKGTSIEEKSYTQLTVIRNHLEAIRKSAEASNLGFVQQMGAASAGGGAMGPETPAQRALRKSLGSAMAAGANANTAEPAAKSIKDIQSWLATLPTTLKATLDTLNQAISLGKKEDVESALTKMVGEIKARKANAAKMSGEAKVKELALAKTEEDAAKKTYAWYTSTYGKSKSPTTGNSKLPGFSSLNDENFGDVMTPGEALGTAAKGVPSAGSKAGGTKVVAPGANVTSNGGEIKINVTGYCLKCKNEIDGNKQAIGTTPVTGP